MVAQASHLFLSYISLYTNAGTPSAREERFGEGGQRAKGPRTDGRRQGPRPVPLHSHQEDGSGPRQTVTIWHKVPRDALGRDWSDRGRLHIFTKMGNARLVVQWKDSFRYI